MKNDILFFYFLIIIRDNFKTMRNIQKILLYRKQLQFSIFDGLLIYYYMVLGLQSECAFQYVEKYWKKYTMLYPILPPPLTV